jgi:hypothetical protein
MRTEECADDDQERIRLSVLAGVRRRVHDLMDSREGHEVLVALLRACAGRHAEVHAIVHATLGRQRHALLRLTNHGYWYENLHARTHAFFVLKLNSKGYFDQKA